MVERRQDFFSGTFLAGKFFGGKFFWRETFFWRENVKGNQAFCEQKYIERLN
jgi:hypothetical protein